MLLLQMCLPDHHEDERNAYLVYFPLWASLVLLNVLNIMVIRIGDLLLVIWHVLVLNNDNVDKLFACPPLTALGLKELILV